MDIGVISVRYARALLNSAVAMKLDEDVYQEMQILCKSFLDVPDFRFTIDNPMLAKDKKLQLIITACGGKVTVLTQRFFQIVLREDRESVLQFMANSYISLYRRMKHVTQGKLITAVAVSPETEQKMKRMVESKTHGSVEFNTEVDPNIIGGFILEYDTYRMDASVKTKLHQVLATLRK